MTIQIDSYLWDVQLSNLIIGCARRLIVPFNIVLEQNVGSRGDTDYD